MNVEKLKRV